MSNLKKYSFHLLITLASIIITLLLTTILYYFNIINPSTYNILKIVSLLLVILINSIFLGKKAKSKGYLEGLKLSLLIIFIFIILTLLFTKTFHLKYLIYYIIIMITSILGGMLGISTRKELK